MNETPWIAGVCASPAPRSTRSRPTPSPATRRTKRPAATCAGPRATRASATSTSRLVNIGEQAPRPRSRALLPHGAHVLLVQREEVRRRRATPRRASGRPVKVLYHSHLDAGAYFSPTDAAVMSMGEPPAIEGGPRSPWAPGPAWPLAFLVTSVVKGEPSTGTSSSCGTPPPRAFVVSAGSPSWTDPMSGFVVWFTGLSGSGKSTLAAMLVGRAPRAAACTSRSSTATKCARTSRRASASRGRIATSTCGASASSPSSWPARAPAR